MASKIFLYWASGSAPCWRVMIALEEKGLSGYGNKFLAFSKNEHKSEEVMKWNPRGQLPTVVFDNTFAINESIAVCEYLEKMYPKQGTHLTPEDPKALAKMLQRKQEFMNLDTKARDLVLYKFFKRGTENGVVDPVKAKKLLDDYLEEVKIWEKYAGEADFIAGPQMTLADLAFFPLVALNVRFGIDLAKHAPNINKYYNRMVKRPSVEKSWPPHWKESPPPASIFE